MSLFIYYHGLRSLIINSFVRLLLLDLLSDNMDDDDGADEE